VCRSYLHRLVQALAAPRRSSRCAPPPQLGLQSRNPGMRAVGTMLLDVDLAALGR